MNIGSDKDLKQSYNNSSKNRGVTQPEKTTIEKVKKEQRQIGRRVQHG